MKKKLLSLVCALALTISLLPAAQALEGEGTRAAEALASLGLVTGTGAGYAAEKPATQEQAAALLVRLLGAEKTAKADRRSCGWAGTPAQPQLRRSAFAAFSAPSRRTSSAAACSCVAAPPAA